MDGVMIGRNITAGLAAAAALALAGLAGCGNGGSAVETRDRPADDAQAVLTAVAAGTPAAKPDLTANRRETVDAKVTRLFQRNGADFNASSAQDYLDKVQAFTTRPPADAERVERPNGDGCCIRPRPTPSLWCRAKAWPRPCSSRVKGWPTGRNRRRPRPISDGGDPRNS